MRTAKPKYQNQGRHPIQEDGLYELKYVCKCCGNTIRMTTEVYVDKNGESGHPCDCDEVEGPHLKYINNNYYWRKINE